MIDIRAYHLATTYPAYYPTTGSVIEPLVVEPDWSEEMVDAWQEYLEIEGE